MEDVMALNNNWMSPNVDFVMKVSILVFAIFKHWESFLCNFFLTNSTSLVFEMVARCTKYLERSAIWKEKRQGMIVETFLTRSGKQVGWW